MRDQGRYMLYTLLESTLWGAEMPSTEKSRRTGLALMVGYFIIYTLYIMLCTAQHDERPATL